MQQTQDMAAQEGFKALNYDFGKVSIEFEGSSFFLICSKIAQRNAFVHNSHY